MSGDKSVKIPAVTWAQSKKVVFITFCVDDCKDAEVKFEPDSIYFCGHGGPEKTKFEVKINLCKEVVPEECKKHVTDRHIEVVLKKKEEGSAFWPHLTKESAKFHWLKIDFAKWQDEDESEDESMGMNGMDGLDFGGMGGGDMGMGDMLDPSKFGGDDSDDEPEEEEEDGEDDKEMPPLVE